VAHWRHLLIVFGIDLELSEKVDTKNVLIE
jgi:hypothetical protein